MAGEEGITAMRQRREEKDTAAALRSLDWGSVVLLCQVLTLCTRCLLPYRLLPGFNECLHLVGLLNKGVTAKKRKRHTVSIMHRERLLNLYQPFVEKGFLSSLSCLSRRFSPDCHFITLHGGKTHER